MKHPTYRIVELKKLPVALLKPHPEAAAVPMDDEDKAAIAESVARLGGVIDPVKVIPDGHGAYLVVDGVNRMASAIAAGHETIMANIIETNDINGVVSDSLVARRKCSTGQRIIVYLENHKDKVLEAYRVNKSKGDLYRKSSKESRDSLDKGCDEFTAEAIAEKLRCSKKDVLFGIALLEAQETSHLPPALAGKNISLAYYLETVAQKRIDVLSGSLAIRRWSPSVSGKVANAGKGKADAQYERLARQAAVTLKNVFDQWGELKWKPPYKISEQDHDSIDEKQMAELAIEAMIKHIPDVFDHIIGDHILNTWSATKRGKLVRMLEEKARQEKKQ